MKDFSNLNALPGDVKLLIVNGQNLVDSVNETIKGRLYRLDLTSKLQLKTDCKEVEKYIKLTERGKLNDKKQKAFELAIVRLKTTLDGVINFYTR